MTRETHCQKALGEQLEEKKRLISQTIINAMRNHPPLKEDMLLILSQIKETFPELEALRRPMRRLSDKITLPWFQMLPIYDIFITVERKLKKKPFSPEHAKDTFAQLLWLALILLFKDDLLKLQEKLEVIEVERGAKELRAEHIIFLIRSTNTLLKKATHSKDVSMFREDVPDFFTRLPTPCRGYDDFLGKIQSLATIFEVDTKPLRALVPDADLNWGSIKLIEKWLENKTPDYAQIVNVWRNIVQLRKIPPTHALMKEEVIDAIEFFGRQLPINFPLLWDSILESFLQSLLKFQEILTNLECE